MTVRITRQGSCIIQITIGFKDKEKFKKLISSLKIRRLVRFKDVTLWRDGKFRLFFGCRGIIHLEESQVWLNHTQRCN